MKKPRIRWGALLTGTVAVVTAVATAFSDEPGQAGAIGSAILAVIQMLQKPVVRKDHER
jgi:hypothetical protein